jgi:hypothetical protein
LALVLKSRRSAPEAEGHLTKALQSLIFIRARFEVVRIHFFVAFLAHVQSDRDAAASHINEAYFIFTALRTPNYANRCERLAREFRVSLTTRPRGVTSA